MCLFIYHNLEIFFKKLVNTSDDEKQKTLPEMVVHTCTPHTEEVKAGGS
jgi:hypothetical protein